MVVASRHAPPNPVTAIRTVKTATSAQARYTSACGVTNALLAQLAEARRNESDALLAMVMEQVREPASDLMSANQIAAWLGFTPKHTRKLLVQWRVPREKYGPKAIRYRRDDVERCRAEFVGVGR